MKSGSRSMTMVPIETESLLKVFVQPHNKNNKISFKVTNSDGKIIAASDAKTGILQITLTAS